MKNKPNLYMDIHALQTMAPSNVNRDDTGAPKTAVYGGVKRARVSSQASKRAVRTYFTEHLDDEQVGKRTKFAPEMVAGKILVLSPELSKEKALDLAVKVLSAAGLKMKDAKSSTLSVLLFLSDSQAQALAEQALKDPKDSKAAKAALNETPSIDIALFGRMVAADPQLNFDACTQVAHAISTHEVEVESDYFTAVDDLKPETSSGAGHVGDFEYSSSTLYRYATINLTELASLIGKEAPEAAALFLKGFLLTVPSGKQNAFASHTIPDAVYLALRTDQPASLVGAFEKPIPAGHEGFLEPSARRMSDYAQSLYSNFIGRPEYEVTAGNLLEDLAQAKPLNEAIEEVKAQIESKLSKGE